MKQYVFGAVLMGLIGGGCESLPSGPSPLETFDQERLYVLIHAAVNRGRGAECARYFQEEDGAPRNPDEVFMRAALSQVCPENMVKIAAYLEHNGVAGVKAAHVKDMAFWDRLKAKDKAAAAARSQEIREVGEAARKCKRAVSDREREERDGKPGLLGKDFPNSAAYRVGWDEERRQAHEQKQKYRAERKACGSGQWSPPSRADLGISLPEGMAAGVGGRIN